MAAVIELNDSRERQSGNCRGHHTSAPQARNSAGWALPWATIRPLDLTSTGPAIKNLKRYLSMKNADEIREYLIDLKSHIEDNLWYGNLDEMAGEAWAVYRSLQTKGPHLEPLADRLNEAYKHLIGAVESIDQILSDIESAIDEDDDSRFFRNLKMMRG
jgi:hypothetical protein